MKTVAAALVAASLMLVGAAHAQGLAQTDAPPAANAGADAVQFLAANAKLPGIVVLPSGLQYRVVRSGPAGASPKPGDFIKVQYEGSFPSGKVFDATPAGKSVVMPLEGLVAAWMEAIPMMHVGDEWTLYVPPSLGYGEGGAGPIPPNSALVFKVKLVGMLTQD